MGGVKGKCCESVVLWRVNPVGAFRTCTRRVAQAGPAWLHISDFRVLNYASFIFQFFQRKLRINHSRNDKDQHFDYRPPHIATSASNTKSQWCV